MSVNVHVLLCVHSFVDEIIQFLDQVVGVASLKQFQALKFDDIEWPAAPPPARKVFIRMALKKNKADKEAEEANRPVAAGGDDNKYDFSCTHM